MRRLFCLCLSVLLWVGPAWADRVTPRDGWMVLETAFTYEELLARTQDAVRESPLAIVAQAGPTGAAASRGVEIPGNRVIGAFNNLFAVRILELSPAAMIEAPIRLYVTENPDGTATLSYKTPSFVFAPYIDEGGPALVIAAAELDEIFEAIAADATLN